MKLAVVAICKNESRNILNWVSELERSKVDTIVVLDTGSTDGTVGLLDQCDFSGTLVVAYYASPNDVFDFAAARNASFALVPDDHFVVWLDLDEHIDYGWVESLRSLDLDNITGIYADWVEGDIVTYQLKAVNPAFYEWRYACHEILVPRAGCDHLIREVEHVDSFRVIHEPDVSKPRQYLESLILSHDKYTDARTAFYLLREISVLASQGRYSMDLAKAQVINLARDFGPRMSIDYASWAYIFAAKLFLSDGDRYAAEYYMRYAELNRPDRAEVYSAFADVYFGVDPVGALHKALKGIEVKSESNFVFEDLGARVRCMQIASDCCTQLGLLDKAFFYKSLIEVGA
jgi:glycosyltransferase involved in cell wall biosynthesis